MFLLIVCLFAVSETTLSKEGIRGSRLEVTLEYTRLKSYEVSSRTDEQEFLEKYEKPEEDSEGKVNTEYDIGRNVTNHTGILYELSMPARGSVPNRFYGIQDFPYLKLGFRDLKFKGGLRFGIESVHARWDSKITTGITGLPENLGRNDRIKEPQRGSSIVTSILRSDGSFITIRN